tara:strand:- start:2 stop:304 length:303 start_codon:yes stop_codon:yes gene_type:complete
MNYFDTTHTATLTDISDRFLALSCPELAGYDRIILSELHALSAEVTAVTHSRRPQIDTDPQSFTYGAMLGEECPIRDEAENIYWSIQFDISLFSDLSPRA